MTTAEAITATRALFDELDKLQELKDTYVTNERSLHKQLTELQSKLSIAIAAESAMEKKLFNATMELEELRRLNLELQKQLNPKDKNGRWVVSFYHGAEKVFTETVFSAPTHEYLSAREKQYNANRWVIIYQSPGITILPHGLC